MDKGTTDRLDNVIMLRTTMPSTKDYSLLVCDNCQEYEHFIVSEDGEIVCSACHLSQGRPFHDDYE